MSDPAALTDAALVRRLRHLALVAEGGLVQPESRREAAAVARAAAARIEAGLPPGPRYGLTPSMKKALTFIDGHIRDHGTAPSFDEIAAGLHLASKSCAHRVVHCLIDRGYLRHIPNSARSLEVIP